MKILVYPHDLDMGGSQINAIELAAEVSRQGHECVVFGRRGSLCARIDELGLEFIESPDPGRRPSPRVARTLRDLVHERGIDVLHGYEWPPGMEAALAAEWAPEVAAVCTVMSMAVAPFLPRRLPLVVGTAQISAAEQAGGRLNVNLIEPPVDLRHNAPHVTGEAAAQLRAELGLDDRPVVASVSRLVPDLKAEGILTAIETAARMAATAPFQLLIVGDGKARTQIEQAAEEANRRIGTPSVFLTGELADPRPAYDAADVMLGMGGSALRSLAFGKPLVVQGERGYFRTLTPDSADEFRWQGWYGVGDGAESGPAALERELAPLLTDRARRSDLGGFGLDVVRDFSLETAAGRQITVYRDAVAGRAAARRRPLDAARSVTQLGSYYVGQRVARLRGTGRADDFNADPVAARARTARGGRRAGDRRGPILYFPGVGWDTIAGTDRHLATALAEHADVVWVDTPHSVVRRRDRVIPLVSHPHPGIVRLRAPVAAGVQRPGLREIASRRRAEVARDYLRAHDLRPRAVIASTSAPMLDVLQDLPGTRVYYATDDFAEAAPMWGVSRAYLSAARERNLRSADLVLAVTPELARHLQRGPSSPRWLPNAAELDRFADIAAVTPAEIPLCGPVAGVVGQFNSRTDLTYLEAVHRLGIDLLLVGPRWFVTDGENAAFDRLAAAPGVHWVDQRPRSELPSFLRAISVGLTPYADSMFNRRSYPLKTLEYLAAGLPVVTTDVAPTRGLDPRFVRPAGTPEEFGRAVSRLLGAPRDGGAIAQSVAGDGWDARADQLLAWLDEEGTP
ncbi:glycosyltransferase family 4 protein [Cumulibacter manganitolerans]|uniref:glycosyltransferase family 4 protein n=1 Tax=Cumulibacter manganitolerans TaxID=1884992 RepID=UPI0012979722|nr:glycosyltransferase [Cumulibacter manganitolerans]